MSIITNPKIEKQRTAIAGLKASVADLQAKLREQEKHLRALEDLEIVARYRMELRGDGHLETLRPDKQPAPLTAQSRPEREEKEDEPDGN
jgi:hypothetical protein